MILVNVWRIRKYSQEQGVKQASFQEINSANVDDFERNTKANFISITHVRFCPLTGAETEFETN